MLCKTHSHTELLRFAKPQARVWSKVIVLTVISLLNMEPVYGQSFEPHQEQVYKQSDQLQYHLLISEILYQASGSGSGEWIEIFNPAAVRIDLSGYQIVNQERGRKRVELSIPSGVFIAPNSYLVISKTTARMSFESFYGFEADLYIDWNGREFANSGEKIDLLDSAGSVIDYVAWKSGQPGGWGNGLSTGADETLCRIADYFVDTNTASDWQVCPNGGNPETQPDEIFVWTGSENNSWTNGSNWTGGVAPGPSPNLDIEITNTVNPPVLDVPLSISGMSLRVLNNTNLTIANSGSLTIEQNGEAITENDAFISVRLPGNYINYGTGSPAIRLEQTIDGAKGWRMISSPFNSNFNQFTENGFVTQGFTGSDYPDKQPNIIFWDESSIGTTLQGWRAPLSMDQNLEQGRGYFHYVFDGAGVSGNDRFYGDLLPLSLTSTGTEPIIGGNAFTFQNITYTPLEAQSGADEQNTEYSDITEADAGWNLAGNPTASTLDWDASGWTKENISETIYVWDPDENGGAGDYLVWNGSIGNLQNGKIAPMQAFWVKATGPDPVLSFTNEAKAISGEFRGKTGRLRREANEAMPSVKLSLSASGYEKEVWLSFSEKGESGYDSWDAFELLPMSENWITFYTSDGQASSPGFVINHLPIRQKDEPTLLKLVMGFYENYRPISTEFTLQWERTVSWPDHLNIYLQDHSTGVMHPINAEADSIRFFYRSPELQASVAAKYLNQDNPLPFPYPPAGRVVKGTGICMGGDCAGSARDKSINSTGFSILVSRAEVTDYLPSAPTLQQNYPNPFNPETTISFSLPEESDVRLQIFDLLGREISTLADGVYKAGTHQLKWKAGSLSSGVYLYRVTIDGRSAITRKMTLMK